MPVRIRLQRRGRRNYATYAVVVADSRVKRDGKFIEKLGIYDPNTYPETVVINVERAVHWLQIGAQPTETARSLLRKAGALYLYHLLKGVKKGAFSEEEAYRRFEEWKKQREEKIRRLKEEYKKKQEEKRKKILEEERKLAEKRAQKYQQKQQEASEEQTAEAQE